MWSFVGKLVRLVRAASFRVAKVATSVVKAPGAIACEKER